MSLLSAHYEPNGKGNNAENSSNNKDYLKHGSRAFDALQIDGLLLLFLKYVSEKLLGVLLWGGFGHSSNPFAVEAVTKTW